MEETAGERSSHTELRRCTWPGSDPEMVQYHDHEWGVPVDEDRTHFEFLVLDGFQAGLSWRTILHRRRAFRSAFQEFDPGAVAEFSEADVERLLADSGIIRHRGKIEAAVNNARCFLEIAATYGSFDAYIWGFTDGRTITNRWTTHEDVPALTNHSTLMAKDLRQHGFRFVGPTICYAYMQGAGLVNDHLTTCFRHGEVARLARR